MKELSKKLVCVVMRNSVELWLEEERAENLKKELLSDNKARFYGFEGRMVNIADIVGIFSAQDMEELSRRKNWQYKCSYGTWHDKGQKCRCACDCPCHDSMPLMPHKDPVTEEYKPCCSKPNVKL